jgi:hypothetical protein
VPVTLTMSVCSHVITPLCLADIHYILYWKCLLKCIERFYFDSDITAWNTPNTACSKLYALSPRIKVYFWNVKVEGKIERTGRRERRRKHLLDDLKEKRKHWNLKEEALA